MCAIAGFTDPGPDAARQLSAMLAALAYRGPDATGLHVRDDAAFGHNRLAIVELSGGAQPRVDEASGDMLSFNGEIYGYRDLARDLRRQRVHLRDGSDTEVLFQLIRRDGVGPAVEQLGGMFAFAYRDGQTGDVYLARDRFGEKPLFYGVHAGQLVFASEPAALLCHPAFRSASPDLASAYQVLTFEYLPGDASGWTGIHGLPPASILHFSQGKASIRRYWKPGIGDGPAMQDAAVVDTLDDLLQRAVAQQLVADVPVGVFLSGGLDSSLLLAVAAKQAPGISALTVRIEGAGYDESGHAADVARHLGVAHEIVSVSGQDVSDALDAIDGHLSDPLADSSLLPTWMVCRAARQRMTVAIGGDGADELFAGYPNFAVQRYAGVMRHLPPATGQWPSRVARSVLGEAGYMSLPFRLAQLGHGFGQDPARQSFHWMSPFGPADRSAIWASGIERDALEHDVFGDIDRAAQDAGPASSLDRLLYQFLTTYLPGDILTKTDRASMFNSLEVRSPFLDRRFASFACGLDGRMKLRGRTRKFALKQVARRYLPARIIDRPKHGFAMPIGQLIRGSIRERCGDTLLSSSNPVAHWFDRRRIESMFHDHLQGRHEHGKRLWALYILFTVAARSRARPTAGRAPVPTKMAAAHA